MKKSVVFFFLSLQMFAQEFPISESNYYIYDKYNYGVDVFNINGSLFQKPNGELYCSEYFGFIYKISNTAIRKALPETKTNYKPLAGHFKFKNGMEYFCGEHEIIISKNEKIVQKIQLNSSIDNSNQFQELNNEIYFVTIYKNGLSLLRKFDGKKVINLLKLKNDVYNYGPAVFITHQINIIEYTTYSIKISKFENGKLILLKKYEGQYKTFSIKQFKDM